MKFTIDRFEDGFVVVELENKDMLDLPILLFPEGSKEGDVFEIRLDEDETYKRKERIEDKFKKLFGE